MVLGKDFYSSPLIRLVINGIGSSSNFIVLIALIPLYLETIGKEGYAILALWQVLLYFFQIFDFGKSSSLMKHFSEDRERGKSLDWYLSGLKELDKNIFFGAIVSVSLIAQYISSNQLVDEYYDNYSLEQFALFVLLFAASVIINIGVVSYLNILLGLDRIFTQNGFLTFYGVLRWLGGFCSIVYFEAIEAFLGYQFFLGLLGLVYLKSKVYVVLVGMDIKQGDSSKLQDGVYRVTLWVSALIGVLLLNSDRIILSNYIDAYSLASYSAGISLSLVVTMLAVPFYKTYLPFFSGYSASDGVNNIRREFIKASQLINSVLIVSSGMIAIWSADIVRYWVGHDDFIIQKTISYSVVAFAMMGIGWLPATFQHAIGKTKLHLSLMALSLVLGVIFVLLLVEQYGVISGLLIIFIHGFLEITIGLYLVFRRYLQYSLKHYYFRTLSSPLFVVLINIPIANFLNEFNNDFLSFLVIFIGLGSVSLLLAFLINRAAFPYAE